MCSLWAHWQELTPTHGNEIRLVLLIQFALLREACLRRSVASIFASIQLNTPITHILMHIENHKHTYFYEWIKKTNEFLFSIQHFWTNWGLRTSGSRKIGDKNKRRGKRKNGSWKRYFEKPVSCYMVSFVGLRRLASYTALQCSFWLDHLWIFKFFFWWLEYSDTAFK